MSPQSKAVYIRGFTDFCKNLKEPWHQILKTGHGRIDIEVKKLGGGDIEIISRVSISHRHLMGNEDR